MNKTNMKYLTQDEVAMALGAKSWRDLFQLLEGGAKLVAPRGSIGVAGKAWDDLRVQFDLVQVRNGGDFYIGRRQSFDGSELEPDLLLSELPNTYDDVTNPLLCPRGDNAAAAREAKSDDSRKEVLASAELVATVLAGIAAVMLMFFGQGVTVAATEGGMTTFIGVLMLGILAAGLMCARLAWLMFSDISLAKHGQEATWSIRKWLPRRWIGSSK